MKRDQNKSLTRTNQVNIERKPEEPIFVHRKNKLELVTYKMVVAGTSVVSEHAKAKRDGYIPVSTIVDPLERTMRGRLTLRVIGNLTESYVSVVLTL